MGSSPLPVERDGGVGTILSCRARRWPCLDWPFLVALADLLLPSLSFHLMKNLRDALELILNRMVEARRAAGVVLAERGAELITTVGAWDDGAADERVPPSTDLVGLVNLPYRKRLQASRREQRLARYEQVVRLHKVGTRPQELARLMRMNTTTVKRYLASESFPERVLDPRLPSKLDPYLPYLERRWVEGETRGSVLLEEVRRQGFVGSLMTVNRWAMRYQQ
jgi:hypothetical protein